MIVLCVPLIWLTGNSAGQALSATPSLDPACIRFDDPNAVVNGEIVYVDFTAYDFALAHALAAWSPERGFAVSFREATPIGDEVPAEASLIVRDALIPGSSFKGVTVTWSNAPATITLNRSELPSPETTDPQDQALLRTVMTHEVGHALGLGDVPAPGVNIRECGEMLMKRSVDKAGGRIAEPQPGDIALYCLRWGGSICGDRPAPTITPVPAALATTDVRSPAVEASPVAASAMYHYFVITCKRFPATPIAPDQVEREELPHDSVQDCDRAPAGVMFDVHLEGRPGGTRVFTDHRGEFAFRKPDGVAAEVGEPEGTGGNFPSLLGYKPVRPVDRIPAYEPACPANGTGPCKRVYVLVP